MSIQQILQNEIEDSKRWIECTQDDSTYKRDLQKRIELINWALENTKNPDTSICDTIESKMNEIIDIINQTHSILEADKLDTEGPLDCMYTNFEDTSVITERVICNDTCYMVR
jgi:conjugal transfer/entry exclusion protein